MAAQAALCLAWSETPEDTFCRVVAQMVINGYFVNFFACQVLLSVEEIKWIFKK